METGILGLIAGIITLAIGILNEFFSAKARERVEQDAFDKAQLEFSVIAQRALVKIYERAAAQKPQDVQDRADDFLANKDKP